MTDIVEEARVLLEQATPGPWRFATNGFDRMVVGGPVVVREFIDTTYETGTFIVGGELHEGAVDEDDPNIKLIIAAPRLLAALADENEQLRAENARLREAMDAARNIVSLVDARGGLGYRNHEQLREAAARLDAAKGVL